MNKIVKSLAMFSASILVVGNVASTSSVVQADELSVSGSEKAQYEQQDINSDLFAQTQELDQYVHVSNNEYVLDVPNDVHVDTSKIVYAQECIVEANKFIEESESTIDPITKIAIVNNAPTRFKRGYGRNYVEPHWNYARVYLNRDWARMVKNGSLGMGAFLAGKIPHPVIAVVSAGLFSIMMGLDVKSGVWVDVNYKGGINNFGWQ